MLSWSSQLDQFRVVQNHFSSLYVIRMLHGQTSCVTLSFQLLDPDSRTLIFLEHLPHLRSHVWMTPSNF